MLLKIAFELDSKVFEIVTDLISEFSFSNPAKTWLEKIVENHFLTSVLAFIANIDFTINE